MEAAPITMLAVLRSGGIYNPRWVCILRDAIARNLSLPHRFVCLSDVEISTVETIPLQHSWPRWWAKAELFRPDLERLGRIFYLDLDTVITGSLDELVSYAGRACIASDFYFGVPSQTALIYEAKDPAMRRIWDTFTADPQRWMVEGDLCQVPHFGDQILMTKIHGPEIDRFQDLYPGQVVSFKVHCQEGLPANARVVSFHGNPKPNETTQPWILEHWREGAKERAHG